MLFWGRPDYLGSDISSVSMSKPFSWYQVFLGNCNTDYLGVFEKLVLFDGLRKMLDI